MLVLNNLKLLRRKKVIIIFIVLLVIAVGVLWYWGNEKKKASSTVTDKNSQALIDQNRHLEQIIAATMAQNKGLKTFNPADLPARASTTDLKIINNNATSTLHNYGLELASILKPYEEKRENEATVMLRLLDNPNNKDQATLQKIAALYHNTETELLSMGVPKDAAYLHTKLINSTRILATLDNNMAQILKEPLLALESADAYEKELPFFYSDIQNLSDFLNRSGVKFSDSEKIQVYVNLQ